jgi:hypothetical protein
MCATASPVLVPIADDLSYTGKPRWDTKLVDSCLADLVEALNQAGILTRSSCCGHGRSPGSILLQDGRELAVTSCTSPVRRSG